MKKPYQLRIVFALNAILMLLPFLFYILINKEVINIVGLSAQIVLYTGFGYILSFIALVYSIMRKKMILFRIIFFVLIAISIPAKAYLGFIIASVSISMSYNRKIIAYFKSK